MPPRGKPRTRRLSSPGSRATRSSRERTKRAGDMSEHARKALRRNAVARAVGPLADRAIRSPSGVSRRRAGGGLPGARRAARRSARLQSATSASFGCTCSVASGCRVTTPDRRPDSVCLLASSRNPIRDAVICRDPAWRTRPHPKDACSASQEPSRPCLRRCRALPRMGGPWTFPADFDQASDAARVPFFYRPSG